MPVSSLQQTANVPASRVNLPQEALTRTAVIPKVVPAPQAVSKDRSGVERQKQDPAAESVLVQWSAQVSERAKVDSTETPSATAQQKADSATQTDTPPAKKSEIQLAMEQQIKDLLKTVWQASAKAVDFLLQRDGDGDTGSIPAPVTSVVDSAKTVSAQVLSQIGVTEAPSPELTDVLGYTSRGTRRLSTQQAGIGRVVNAVA